MTTTKISQLTASAGVTDTDLLLTVVSGASGFLSRKTTAAQLCEFVTSSISNLSLTSISASSANFANISGKLNGLATNVVTVSADATLNSANHIVLVNAVGGNKNITLPDAVEVPNFQFAIKKIDASVNIVTVLPSGSQTIDGISSRIINTQYEAVLLVSDGLNWFIF